MFKRSVDIACGNTHRSHEMIARYPSRQFVHVFQVTAEAAGRVFWQRRMATCEAFVWVTGGRATYIHSTYIVLRTLCLYVLPTCGRLGAAGRLFQRSLLGQMASRSHVRWRCSDGLCVTCLHGDVTHVGRDRARSPRQQQTLVTQA